MDSLQTGGEESGLPKGSPLHTRILGQRFPTPLMKPCGTCFGSQSAHKCLRDEDFCLSHDDMCFCLALSRHGMPF